MEQWLVLGAAMLATGCVAGVLAGLFGIGGGIVIVPVLEAVLGLLGVDPAIRMHVAVATSLATIIPTSLSSARAHYRRNSVDVDIVRRWSGFVLAGALLGAWLASRLHSDVLAIVFATLAGLVGLKMIFLPDTRNVAADIPRTAWVPVIPTFIGGASSMMGIGGGTFSVMTLTLFNTPIHRAVGTAALFGLVISLPGTLGFIVTGLQDARMPPGNLGYVNLLGFALIAPATLLTAPLGARIAHSFSARRLGKLFGIFLLIAAGRLVFAGELQADPPIECNDCAAWNEPVTPFRIHGNTYSVGVAGISSVLIDAGSQLVLIDGGLPQSAAPIVENIRALGFEPADIDAIFVSHAHFDHVGGIAALQRLSGARVISSEAGAAALRAGDLQEDDPLFGMDQRHRVFPAVMQVIESGDNAVHEIGPVRIRGLHTPGHTPGGMSWTWESCEADDCRQIVYADSLSPISADGYRFATGLGPALRASAERLAALDCDIILTTHPFFRPEDCAEHAATGIAALDRRLAAE